MQDSSQGSCRLSIGDVAHAQQARLSCQPRDDAIQPLTEDRVAVAEALALAVHRNVALTGDLLRTPAPRQMGFHDRPVRGIDARLGARGNAPLRAALARTPRRIAFVVRVAMCLSTDRAGITRHRRAGLPQRPSAIAQALDLPARLLAQVRVIHVPFHSAVKRCRLRACASSHQRVLHFRIAFAV